ncbi:MAG: hypothetical protein WBM83_15475 [Flavobacteriaceae bacterium]
MAFEDLKEDLIDADADMRSYLENSEEYLKLKVFKVFMRSITAAAQALLVGAVMLLALVLLSLAAALGIGQLLDNTFQGFLIVGAFYVLLGILCYAFRDRLNRPLLRKFSEYYFDTV